MTFWQQRGKTHDVWPAIMAEIRRGDDKKVVSEPKHLLRGYGDVLQVALHR